MNLQKSKFLLLCFMCLIILSCNKEELGKDIEQNETSSISLSLKTDLSENIVAFTRVGNLPDESDFRVKIENTKSEVLRDWRYDSLPSVINVVSGSYKLVGFYGNEDALPDFESPYYYGETKVTLKDWEKLDTVVNVSLASVKVAVTFDESFTYEYDEYSVDIKTVGDSLNFTNDESRAAYFLPGKLRMKFHLKPIGSDTTYYFYPDIIADAKAKDFYNITLKASTEKGGSIISIITDTSTIELPVELELPNFFLPKDAPKFNTQGFNAGESIFTTEGVSQPALVTVYAGGGLTELSVEILSDDLINEGWPAVIDLMSASDEERTKWKEYGLEWSKELETQDTIKTTVYLKFDNAIKLLNTVPDATTEAIFKITGKDRFEQEDGLEINVQVEPPVFELVEMPVETDVYAKKAHLKVNYISEAKSPVVQYKDGVGEWQSLNTEVVALGDGIFECIGRELEPETTYEVRIALGNHFVDAGSITTEAASQLPNSGMEDWYSEGIGWTNGSNSLDISTFYLYTDTEVDPWWATLNKKTTQQINNSNSYYHSAYPGTVPLASSYAAVGNNWLKKSTNIYSGSNAVEISTVGWGANSWSKPLIGSVTITGPEYITPGMLFIGNYNFEEDEIEYGKSFASRPSSLQFQYRFYPCYGESFKVYVSIENRENETIQIGYGELISSTEQDNYNEANIEINYEQTDLKATHISVIFLSSNSDNPLTQEYHSYTVSGVTRRYHQSRFIGNVLIVDDIELVY